MTDIAGLRQRARKGWRRSGDGKKPGRQPARPRWLKWAKRFGIACLAWILLSFLAFAVSAQIQSGKLDSAVASILGGGPFMTLSPQTILVIGTDARPPGTKDPGEQESRKCFEQQASGAPPSGGCPPHASDSLMLIRAGGGIFRKLSIPRDSYAEIEGLEPQKINAAYAVGGAKLTIKTVEHFLKIHIDHVVIVDFKGFVEFINALEGINVNVPVKVCSEISGGRQNGGQTLILTKGEHTLSGEEALAYSRTRHNSCDPAYTDLNREAAQQGVIAGIKERLTDPLRLPYNFIMGPIIGWDAPQAFISDMGFFTMPQLVLAAAIGGSSSPDVLCGRASLSECNINGPGDSVEIPESVRHKAVQKFLNG
jgi:LCP family protein required for cell wall assembly